MYVKFIVITISSRSLYLWHFKTPRFIFSQRIFIKMWWIKWNWANSYFAPLFLNSVKSNSRSFKTLRSIEFCILFMVTASVQKPAVESENIIIHFVFLKIVLKISKLVKANNQLPFSKLGGIPKQMSVLLSLFHILAVLEKMFWFVQQEHLSSF